jgi:hypothetical protein
MAGKYKAELKDFLRGDKLSRGNREFLDRMINDPRMEEVLDTVLAKISDFANISPITAVIWMLLSSRDNAEEIKTIEARARKADEERAFWLARADAAN